QIPTEDVISLSGSGSTVEDLSSGNAPALVDDADIRLALNLNICPECHKDAGRHLYDHLFTVHGYSKYDVEKAKQQKRRWKLFSTASPSYICNVCNLPYKTRRALLQHRKEKEHYSEDGETLQLILCPLCDEHVQDQEELMNHVSHEHAAFLKANFGFEKPKLEHQQPGMNFGHVLCPECGKSFKKEHIGEHAIFVHNYTNRERQVLLLHLGVELTTPVPELSFKCEHCSKGFGRKHDLNIHLLNQHSYNPSTSVGNACPCGFDGCRHSFSSYEDLATHCARMHSKESGQQFEIINVSFNSKKDFLNWKHDVERKTGALFRFRCTSKYQTAVYVCATTFTNLSNDEQESSPKKAKVSEQYCTAFIKCRPRSDGTVEAIGCLEHTGHAENPCLDEEQKDEACRLL
ncbi:zinc finger, C2H2 type, partial [Ostertagia ostertagi]